MKDQKEKVIKDSFSRFTTGFALSKALLEDYARVVAKLEETTEEEVVNRIRSRADEIFREIKVENEKALK